MRGRRDAPCYPGATPTGPGRERRAARRTPTRRRLPPAQRMRASRHLRHTAMLKRDDIELEHADAGNGNGATRTLSRGERLALLAEEDELAPRVKVPGGTPMIVLERVTKVYDGARGGPARRLAAHRQGRVGLPGRPVRLGQVDVHPPADQGARPDRGLDPDRRPLARHAQALARRAAAPQHRLRLPGLQAAAQPQRVPERGLRARGAGPAAPDDRREGARDPAARRPRRTSSTASRTSSPAASSSASRSRARSSTTRRS